jgi:signal transduction histidine kinase
LGVFIPLILVLVILTFFHYNRERQLIQEQLEIAANQIAAVTLSSLRHAMLNNDEPLLNHMLADVERTEMLDQIQILDNEGAIWASSNPTSIGKKTILETPPAVFLSELPGDSGLLRITYPIQNEPACHVCHDSTSSTLGAMLIDVSLIDVQNHLLIDLRLDLIFIMASAILIAVAVYFLIEYLVVRRVESFHEPLSAFASGDFSARLPEASNPQDELGELASTFNQVADELARHMAEESERHKLRQNTIIEERERIARELHDGLAQLLGFVKTKVMAVRLLLKHQQLETADEQLKQLENAAENLYTETRQAILGLKMAGDIDTGLAETLREFVPRFCDLCDISIDLEIAPPIETLSLPTETELQLLRVVQEALTNVHKHSQAGQAWIKLDISEGELALEIRDNGTGFSMKRANGKSQPNYGLAIMQERSEAIGATFDVNTRPGYGTTIQVTLPIEGVG